MAATAACASPPRSPRGAPTGRRPPAPSTRPPSSPARARGPTRWRASTGAPPPPASSPSAASTLRSRPARGTWCAASSTPSPPPECPSSASTSRRPSAGRCSSAPTRSLPARATATAGGTSTCGTWRASLPPPPCGASPPASVPMAWQRRIGVWSPPPPWPTRRATSTACRPTRCGGRGATRGCARRRSTRGGGSSTTLSLRPCAAARCTCATRRRRGRRAPWPLRGWSRSGRRGTWGGEQ
ncbi:hypothetical protein BU14_2696s0001 [Porphyra umbilicalis]|uniref:Uncharacterized protein n=1 Tax=Porphyra umbilicalis TaxID=2786 RepID=A0A1X6NIR0_PORUM|nr:hypothetical protein BU14_2696s0001 [Porphyra umbilicalis]|eukprot:OSX68495.1 hypothetical protein BU14_2696s0001 [Porphyra umbilicalis]